MSRLYIVKVAHRFRYIDGDCFDKIRPIKILGAFSTKDEAIRFTHQTKAPSFLHPFQDFYNYFNLALTTYDGDVLYLKDLVGFCRKHNLPDPAKELTRALHSRPRSAYELQEILLAWWQDVHSEMTLEQHQIFWGLIGYAPFEIIEVELA